MLISTLDGADRDLTVRRAMPLLGRAWPPVAAQISALLHHIATARTPDDRLPDPLRAARVRSAWDRLAAVINPTQILPIPTAHTVYPALAFLTVHRRDIDLVGDTAAILTRHGISDRDNTTVAEAVRWAAELTACTTDDMIRNYLRVAAVLRIDLGPDGDILREWGADGPVFVSPPYPALAAHRRIAARIYSTWHTAPDPPRQHPPPTAAPTPKRMSKTRPA